VTKKIAIPVILAATVVVATALAVIMPVHLASTVHRTIQDAQLEVQKFTTASPNSNPITRNVSQETLTIDCDKDFALLSLHLDGRFNDFSETLQVDQISIDGVVYELEVAETIVLGAEGALTMDSEVLSALAKRSSTDKPLPGGFAIAAKGAGNNDIVFRTAGTVDGTAETINAVAGILSRADVSCTVVGT